MEGVRGELLEAQRKLDQANSRVEYILNAIHDGLWEDNFKTGEFNFSDKMFTMLGYQPVAGREGFNFLMSKVQAASNVSMPLYNSRRPKNMMWRS